MEKGQKTKPEDAKRVGTIVRVVETNLNGSKPVSMAIQGIPGVGAMFSHAVSTVSGFGNRTLESLSAEELKMLTDIITHPQKFAIPSWMMNRLSDPVNGENRHLTASALMFSQRTDINEMKKLRIYKGIRHAQGLPVRGQRTRGSFRKGKTVGVSKRKQQPGKK